MPAVAQVLFPHRYAAGTYHYTADQIRYIETQLGAKLEQTEDQKHWQVYPTAEGAIARLLGKLWYTAFSDATEASSIGIFYIDRDGNWAAFTIPHIAELTRQAAAAPELQTLSLRTHLGKNHIVLMRAPETSGIYLTAVTYDIQASELPSSVDRGVLEALL